MGAPSHSVAGELSLPDLAALIERAPLLISGNTGPVHIAAAVGTPVVDLYALTNPQHTPWLVPGRVLNHDVPCQPCYKSICPEGHHHCLELVEPGEVVRAALDLLRDFGSRTRGVPAREPAGDACGDDASLILGPRSSSMYTLGINAAYHDSAACLVRDGRVLAAAEDERFTHIKHGKRPVPFSTWELPFHAIDYCLRRGRDRPGRRGSRRLFVRPRPPAGQLSRRRRRSRSRWSRMPSPRTNGKSPWDAAVPLLDRQCPAASSLDGAPHHLQARFRGVRARRAPSAGISWRITWRTPPAPSTPLRSSGPPS